MSMARFLSKLLNSSGLVPASSLAPGAISSTTILSTGKVEKFKYGNASPNQQPLYANFTLSAAEAPIGSFVLLSLDVGAGNSAGQQYCTVSQRADDNYNFQCMSAHTYGWYWAPQQANLFYISDASDRTFYIRHGTISYTNNNDYRRVCYHGYLKVTQ